MAALLIGCLALGFPRVAVILVVIFSDYIGRAYETTLWPLLGFFFMPLTTLAYAWAMNENEGSVSGIYLVMLIAAVIFDLGLLGTGERSRRRYSSSPERCGAMSARSASTEPATHRTPSWPAFCAASRANTRLIAASAGPSKRSGLFS